MQPLVEGLIRGRRWGEGQRYDRTTSTSPQIADRLHVSCRQERRSRRPRRKESAALDGAALVPAVILICPQEHRYRHRFRQRLRIDSKSWSPRIKTSIISAVRSIIWQEASSRASVLGILIFKRRPRRRRMSEPHADYQELAFFGRCWCPRMQSRCYSRVRCECGGLS